MAVSYFCIDSRPSAGIPGEVHATQLNTLGTERVFSVNGVPMTYIYLQGVASTVAGSVAVYQPVAFTTALVSTGVRGDLAIASAAIVASTYGWYLIIGQDVGVARSAIASNVPLFIGGVAGSLDDVAVKGDQVFRATSRNAAAGGGDSVILQVNRAFVGFTNESVA